MQVLHISWPLEHFLLLVCRHGGSSRNELWIDYVISTIYDAIAKRQCTVLSQDFVRITLGAVRSTAIVSLSYFAPIRSGWKKQILIDLIDDCSSFNRRLHRISETISSADLFLP